VTSQNPGFFALLDARVTDDGDLARLGGLWLELASRHIAPQWWGAARDRVPAGAPGVPAGVRAHVVITSKPAQDVTARGTVAGVMAVGP